MWAAYRRDFLVFGKSWASENFNLAYNFFVSGLDFIFGGFLDDSIRLPELFVMDNFIFELAKFGKSNGRAILIFFSPAQGFQEGSPAGSPYFHTSAPLFV